MSIWKKFLTWLLAPESNRQINYISSSAMPLSTPPQEDVSMYAKEEDDRLLADALQYTDRPERTLPSNEYMDRAIRIVNYVEANGWKVVPTLSNDPEDTIHELKEELDDAYTAITDALRYLNDVDLNAAHDALIDIVPNQWRAKRSLEAALSAS